MPEVEPLRSEDPTEVGPYRLAGRLGMGGQGVVYLGSGPDGVNVAVKLLREEFAADPRVRERFMKEIDAARRVDPFCIAQVLDASMDGTRPYVVTEYVEGPSLQQAGPREGAASLQRLAVATATALAAIHHAGIVHRDFKPSNVLLGPDGPRVIDFGIARDTAAPLTMTSSIIGTPAYMAPEQFEGQFVGAPADVFAWGAVMAFAATGRPPFGADTFPAIMNRVLRGEPDLGDLGEPLRSLAVACLAKDPSARPSMQDVMLRLVSARSATATGPQQPSRTAPSPAFMPMPSAASAGPTAVDSPPTGPSGPGGARSSHPMPHDTQRRQRPSSGQGRVLLAVGAAAAAVLLAAGVTTAILWPHDSEASNSRKGANAAGGGPEFAGRQGVPNSGGSGNPADGRGGGANGKPSPGASSPNASGGPGDGSSPSPRTSPGQNPRGHQSPSRPTPTKSSGGGGGGDGGSGGGGGTDSGRLSLSIFGSKRGDCYVSAGYQWGVYYPDPSWTIYLNGSVEESGTSSSGKSKLMAWAPRTHTLTIRLRNPSVSKSVSFTACG